VMNQCSKDGCTKRLCGVHIMLQGELGHQVKSWWVGGEALHGAKL
jgi:hypothetical protein